MGIIVYFRKLPELLFQYRINRREVLFRLFIGRKQRRLCGSPKLFTIRNVIIQLVFCKKHAHCGGVTESRGSFLDNRLLFSERLEGAVRNLRAYAFFFKGTKHYREEGTVVA